MSLKKFLAPSAVVLIALSVFWLAGVESVVPTKDIHKLSLKKYAKAQEKIIDNYVDKIDLTKLYENSIRGFVSNLPDSTTDIKGTPIDTTFSNLKVKNLRSSVRKFDKAYNYVSNHFSSEDMTALTENAIRAMFDQLDPHSIYIPPKRSDAIEEKFAGKFQGVGIQFNIIQDTITVITPISGGPSDKLGILSGDRIVKINDSTAVGFSIDDVRNTLRGPKGSKVDVTIKRPHEKSLLHFTITRDDIPLYTIDTSYMLDNKTGYVKINRFAATTHKEFMEAMNNLQSEGMDRIVIDLRGNPGGYLGQAIGVAEEFYHKGVTVLSTKSRHPRYTSTYQSRRNGKFTDMPLIVLVNKGSASASEIVSGAIQDHDRGLIVGQRTFGKGLVQQQYALADSSKIRVTISRYYTPSGRLIQKPYSNEGSQEYAYEIYKRSNNAKTDVKQFISHVPDSLKHYTDAGRTVYGGGGIVPDHIVQEDTSQSAAVFGFMQRERIGFNFVRNFLDNHGDEFRQKWENNYDKFRKKFEWSKQNMATVHQMLLDSGLVETASDTLKDPDYKADTLYIPKGHFQEVEWMSRGLMKADLAQQVWGLKKYYPVINDTFDKTLKKAMKLWPEVQELKIYASSHTK